jgi:hypothetical protein
LNAFELPLERTWIIETAAINDLHRAHFGQDVASKPHLAIRSGTDPLQEFMIGNKSFASRGRQVRNIPAQDARRRMHAKIP